jgi:hypothetical protein
MADMGEYTADKYTAMVKTTIADLGRTADKLAFAQNILRALKNPDMMVDGAPLTLERLQVMENGDIRTLPPPPEMTCIEEVTREFGKNGKKDKKDKEAVLANDPA